MADTLRVGMIGLSADGGWAREGHVPAVQHTEGLELLAVGSRRQGSADRAAASVGAARAYGDPQRLIDDPDVDIVAVVSPVPTHRRWLLAAAAAGKHVLTEWPVAVHPTEVEEIAAAIEAAGVSSAVDLQARRSRAAERAKALLAEGRIGRVLGSTVLSSTAAFGPVVPEAAVALERPETGMHLRTIQTAHTIDLLAHVVAPIATVQAAGAVQFPRVRVEGSGQVIERTVPDRVLLQGALADGSTFSVQVVGGRPADDAPFVLEVLGTDGSLVLTGGGPRGFQASPIAVRMNGDPIDLDGPAEPTVSAANVARVYAALRDDIREGTATAPDFADAVRLARLTEALGAAIDSGERLTVGDASDS